MFKSARISPPEHFPVEFQRGSEIGRKKMGMMDVVLHF